MQPSLTKLHIFPHANVGVSEITAPEHYNYRLTIILIAKRTLTMLRRKPTALTITNEDIASFEEAHLRRLAYAKYLKTGEDPEGLFRNGAGPEGTSGSDAQMSGDRNGSGQAAGAGAVDPNDELKPLPGDKARIVRSREERIMGAGSAR